MAPFEALYGRRCRSLVGWFEVGDIALLGPESIYKDMEKVRLIRERLRTAQSRQKYYSDVRRRDLEFECIGDPVCIIPLEGLGVDESFSYEEVPVEIFDRKVKRLRNKEVASVKVLWRNHLVEGATWRLRPI
ncbi:uncharacterized protein LOC125819368 [Solanum verrucosum]|uniref:uncharacterized protein LOC125819368 n=1 Tax=Solanum verrucosum TaxID=315347 RepID=UPI0020D0DEE5|nr:uncharacterized protein LOC125819368 [Solanum verrucosum]